jgi:hypothetical protein
MRAILEGRRVSGTTKATLTCSPKDEWLFANTSFYLSK